MHAGYIFEQDDTKIVFDPIFENPFSGNCYAFPSVSFDVEKITELTFTAIFVSHFHDDHCSFESLKLFDRSTPIYIHCIYDELFEMVRELGFKNVYQLKFEETVQIRNFEVISKQPLDEDVDSMFQIKVGGLKILNVVDSVLDSDSLEALKSDGPWDLVLWPFQTMRETAVLTPSRNHQSEVSLPAEWFDELKALSPRFIVPSACQFVQEPWSWYNNSLFPITYRHFEEEIAAKLPSCQVIRMNPGTSIVLDQNTFEVAESLSWVRPSGDQNVDYTYRPEMIAPLTTDIAKHFPPLSPHERERSISFCKRELLNRFQKLEPTPFFSKARLWRLSVFDHEGAETRFHYKIENCTIEIVESVAHPMTTEVEWLTEVPLSKLYAALERGETLTSMYVRVNDFIFSDRVESDLYDMNVLEDPLIRTLFEGRFGSYQRGQLRRLKSMAADLA